MGLFSPKYPTSDTPGATGTPTAHSSNSPSGTESASTTSAPKQTWREKRRGKEWVRQQMINQGG